MKRGRKTKVGKRFFDDNLVRYSVCLFLAELAIFVLAAFVPLSGSGLLIFSTILSRIRLAYLGLPFPLLTLLIFLHNALIATFEFVPLLGVLLFITSMVVTPLSATAYATVHGGDALRTILYLLTLPHSWLELPPYAIGTVEGVFLLKALFNNSFDEELKRAVRAWKFAVVMLFFAALFETAEVELQKVNVLYPYLLWIFVVPLAYAFYKYVVKKK